MKSVAAVGTEASGKAPDPVDEKTVSVIVVSHNYGEFLSEALESVFEQTRLPDFILIMDDASDDGTCEIGRRYAELYPTLVVYERNEVRLGIVETFNRSVSMVSGDLICFLGADNRISSGYVESCAEAISQGVDIAYTDFRLFGKNARKEYETHVVERRGRIIDGEYYEIVFPEFTPGIMRQGNFIHGSAMYTKSAFVAVGGYRERRPGRPEDANLFRRMLSAGFLAQKADGAWLEYRQHSDQQANVVSRMQGDLHFYKVYSKRLEWKIKALEASFGLLSPFIRLLGCVETTVFQLGIKVVRLWRRATR